MLVVERHGKGFNRERSATACYGFKCRLTYESIPILNCRKHSLPRHTLPEIAQRKDRFPTYHFILIVRSRNQQVNRSKLTAATQQRGACCVTV